MKGVCNIIYIPQIIMDENRCFYLYNLQNISL